MLEISKTHRIAYRLACDVIVKIGSADCNNGRTYPLTKEALQEIRKHGFVTAQHAIAVKYNNEIIGVSKKELFKYNLTPCDFWMYHQTDDYIRENINEFKENMPNYDFSEILKGV